MVFRQTAGGGLSPLDSWITLVFIQLGFIVTAGSLAAPLLALWAMPGEMIWRLCGGVAGMAVVVFSVSYPARRRAVSSVPTPLFVWIDLFLLMLCALALLLNAIGWPFTPNAAVYSAGLTGVLFIGGLGYLQALGNLHKETKRAGKMEDRTHRDILQRARENSRIPTETD